jgi:hypothetical protein
LTNAAGFSSRSHPRNQGRVAPLGVRCSCAQARTRQSQLATCPGPSPRRGATRAGRRSKRDAWRPGRRGCWLGWPLLGGSAGGAGRLRLLLSGPLGFPTSISMDHHTASPAVLPGHGLSLYLSTPAHDQQSNRQHPHPALRRPRTHCQCSWSRSTPHTPSPGRSCRSARQTAAPLSWTSTGASSSQMPTWCAARRAAPPLVGRVCRVRPTRGRRPAWSFVGDWQLGGKQ